jgi:hypothetical protein
MMLSAFGLRLVVARGKTLPKAFDALRDIAHGFGGFTPSEQQNVSQGDDKDVRPAQARLVLELDLVKQPDERRHDSGQSKPSVHVGQSALRTLGGHAVALTKKPRRGTPGLVQGYI